MEKILVLRGGALGDFIVTLPALALLRTRWPRARIELAGNAAAAQLAVARGLLDIAHSQHEARWAGLYDAAALSPSFERWLGTFDLVVSFWPDPDGELRRRLPLHERQQFIAGSALPDRSPAAAHYCEPLRSLGLEPGRFFYALERLADDNDDDRAATSAPGSDLAKRILIHPGSGSPTKNWPAENWRTLIAALPHPVTLVLGEAELSTWSPEGELLAGGNSPNPSSASAPNTLVNASLETLVSAFAQCRLFLGHDSGVSHLAAASGAKCVLLFGPTEPACWAPPAPGVRVLRRGADLAGLPVDDVRDAVTATLADRT